MPWQNNILMLQIVWCKNPNNIARKNPSPLSDNGSFWAIFFLLFENRIGKQDLVIYCTSHLYGSLGNHKLYGLPFHFCLKHDSSDDESGRESGTPFIFPHSEPVLVCRMAYMPFSRILIVCEINPSSTENPQFNRHCFWQVNRSLAVHVDCPLPLINHLLRTWVFLVIYYQCHKFLF